MFLALSLLFFYFFLLLLSIYLFSLARHAWLLSSGCGVYHGHAGSSSSRLLRFSLGASKRVVAAASSGGLLGRSSHHPVMAPSQSVPLEVNPSCSAASASYCDMKTKRKVREKTIKSNRSTGPSGLSCPVMPRDPMTDGLAAGKHSRPSPSRRPLTRSVLRASLSPLAGPGTPSTGVSSISSSSASKKTLAHHGSLSVKPSAITHPRRLLASHTPMPK